ncbi:MAG: hypothetical protein OHK005_03570 [Candidatus Methylacidiphilales bacterium]
MDPDDSFPWFRRVLPGAFLIGLGLFLLQGIATGQEAEVVETVFRALMGLAFMVAGAVLVARPLAQLIVTPFVRMLFPEDHNYTPPPLYSLARHYRKQGRSEEALVQYRKILKHHPREAEAYQELVQLLLALDRSAEAESVYKKGMATLKDQAAREKLDEFYREQTVRQARGTFPTESPP